MKDTNSRRQTNRVKRGKWLPINVTGPLPRTRYMKKMEEGANASEGIAGARRVAPPNG